MKHKCPHCAYKATRFISIAMHYLRVHHGDPKQHRPKSSYLIKTTSHDLRNHLIDTFGV